jgi:CDP-glucose 4,6-dehydratase
MSGGDADFWRGRRVLLTGHTGFKGSWAALWLKRAGAKVTGLALPPDTDPALFDLAGVDGDVDHHVVDLRDRSAVAEAVAGSRPEIVIHLAAQAIVNRAVREPVETFATNVLGAVHLLDALRSASGLAAILVVTTDKVYENAGDGKAFQEADRLGGRDPYSASKAAVEMAVRAYAETYFAPRGVALATARGGNVIGGGDFGEDRLVPDIFRAVRKGETLALRRPEAVRPWQHVLDCVAGYLAYAEALAVGRDVPCALNFGPAAGEKVPVSSVAEAVLSRLGASASWRHDPAKGGHDAATLVLDGTLARRRLGWENRLPGQLAIDWTAEWYQALARGDDMRAATMGQLESYLRLVTAASGKDMRESAVLAEAAR